MSNASSSRPGSGDPGAVAPLLPLWIALPVAALAGGVLNLAFPAPSVWGCSFLAVALLLVALIGRRTWAALLVGAVYGIVFSVVLVSWTGTYLGPIPWLALGILEGALTAVGCIPIALAYRWLPALVPASILRAFVTAVVVAALWIARELLLGTWPYGGFPWARIALTMSPTAAADATSWIGISGLGFAMVLIVALAVEAFRGVLGRRRVLPIAALSGAALLAALLVVAPAFPTATAGTMRIGAVQGNGPTGYFDHREPGAVLSAQWDASQPLLDENVDLIVWPEGGIDGDPFQNAALSRTLDRLTSAVGAPLLGNAATETDGRYFNTSFLWPLDGPALPARDEAQTHAKRHPVPFGEYVPDRDFYAAIVPDLIGLIQREYTPGADAPTVDVSGTVVGLAICFDVIYDEVIQEGIDAGAQVLVFQTNNADFRGTAENLQQLAIARMRAVETGRSVVNISTVGTSQIIRPDGTTQASVDADRPGALLDDVELRTGATAGVVFGPILEQILLWGGLLSVVVAGLCQALRRRSSRG
ncbi:apolipoprotein N-acyltransferase [Microbacterium pseudoresistens]|uniref:Apolipoprotein N-acyltransferase n=1 Tax=Microbacterium pseudoresistens TaxID=640634 RepID=A0A7Y9EWU4_9MICO|nr:apolipoprotein N-acyltransferase [Microbacterium pseudoresistens]NYD55424.1 apolipoprotein N-acyltransferase [Microbacterium pseudoresistens]